MKSLLSNFIKEGEKKESITWNFKEKVLIKFSHYFYLNLLGSKCSFISNSQVSLLTGQLNFFTIIRINLFLNINHSEFEADLSMNNKFRKIQYLKPLEFLQLLFQTKSI